MVGVAVELTCSYDSKLSPRPPSQGDLLADAQLLVDSSEVASREYPDGTVAVVLGVMDGVCVDAQRLEMTVEFGVFSK